jgi:hypothetical protein
MEDNLWDGYVLFLKNVYNLTPEEKYFNINAILELKSLRDEFCGLIGDTQMVKLLKKDGTFEETKKSWGKYFPLTFEEYKEELKKNEK